MIAKLSAYRKESSPGIDDNTVPGSNIVTSVNIDQVKITGLEAVLEFRPSGPVLRLRQRGAQPRVRARSDHRRLLSRRDTPDGFFDLDHDQRLSMVGSATYAANRCFLSATGIYGSGLTNGVDPADCNCTVGTGLFDFNKAIHVDPSTIFNASAGYTIVAGQDGVSAAALRRERVQQEVLLEGRVLQRRVGGSAAQHSGAAQGRVLAGGLTLSCIRGTRRVYELRAKRATERAKNGWSRLLPVPASLCRYPKCIGRASASSSLGLQSRSS